MQFPGLGDIARITTGRTRSISAENPTGGKGKGAQAAPGDDPNCTAAADRLGKGWKVRPCLRNIEPGATVGLADIRGPGVIQHMWFTVLDAVGRWLTLRIYWDDQAHPSVEVPLGDFFCNSIDGMAVVNSLPIVVNPKGGMNSYWPMPFRGRCRIEVTNDGPGKINELFFQITYAEQDVPADAGYFHATWRRSMTTREKPEHVILDGVAGRGQYVGTAIVWS